MKKYITKYLLKYFNGSSQNYRYVRDNIKFYLFLRWLSEFVKVKKDTDDVLISIACYMQKKALNLPFTDIFIIENVVIVCTRRPGLWIGKDGSVINEITHEINFNIEGEKIHDFHIQILEITKGAVADIFGYMRFYSNF